MKISQNQKGQTIIESLVGLGLIAIVGFAFTGGMVALRNTTKSAVNLSATERQINDIAENIKSGVENYQVNYNYDQMGSMKNANEALQVESLPMAWDNDKVLPREQCPNCAGSYGYIIQPLEIYRGLYQVTLRMTHKDWISKGEPFRDYTFVVSTK
ncbi:type II secretion system protein [Bdellovibrio svalbardensis]|uniref:Type II secretion system GspH family protein n=1 Tax=Bdellovibrio svalbardensis TaxID=2972972 RepID=A0ABT6DIK6_9BACT|nr:type II secretion system protein [Bdellovibrio svalbardensis]MDG0816354.1 type II secretion system GspH family protein [Bdellovibrio svalbardensis]